MIDYETFLKIGNFRERDMAGYSQIAEKLSLALRTVASWAREKSWRPRKSPKRTSKLDPFKSEIARMLEKFPHSAEEIFLRIRR